MAPTCPRIPRRGTPPEEDRVRGAGVRTSWDLPKPTRGPFPTGPRGRPGHSPGHHPFLFSVNAPEERRHGAVPGHFYQGTNTSAPGRARPKAHRAPSRPSARTARDSLTLGGQCGPRRAGHRGTYAARASLSHCTEQWHGPKGAVRAPRLLGGGFHLVLRRRREGGLEKTSPRPYGAD